MESPGSCRGRNAGKSREVAFLRGATGSRRWGLHKQHLATEITESTEDGMTPVTIFSVTSESSVA